MPCIAKYVRREAVVICRDMSFSFDGKVKGDWSLLEIKEIDRILFK